MVQQNVATGIILQCHHPPALGGHLNQGHQHLLLLVMLVVVGLGTRGRGEKNVHKCVCQKFQREFVDGAVGKNPIMWVKMCKPQACMFQAGMG